MLRSTLKTLEAEIGKSSRNIKLKPKKGLFFRLVIVTKKGKH